MLKISNLTKKYGPITAVNNLSLEVDDGNVFGILGPNGSGKTTTLGIILGIIKANSGAYEWFEGETPRNTRRRIGAILETPNFYPYLNADDNLDIIAHIKKVSKPRVDELLELVNLKHRRKSRFKTYSLGMKQRLAIAGALIGDPDVLIFDEPTNGLDPQGIAEVRNTLLQIADTGKTIIMASHILDEVEKICSHVAIIKNGTLLATGTVGSILEMDQEIILSSDDNNKLLEILTPLAHLYNLKVQNGFITGSLKEGFSTADINLLAFQKGITLTHLVAKKPSLESEFLEITKGA